VSDLLQIAFSGLTVGAAYALVALGFAIVFRGTRAINFAQGEYVMLAGVAAGALNEAAHPPLLVTVVAVILMGALAGVLTEVVALRLIRRPDPATVTLATIGLAVTIKAAVLLITDRASYTLPGFSGDASLRIAGATLEAQTLWNCGLVAVAAGGLALFFSRTRIGVALRASADDAEMAASTGMSRRTATAWSFGLAGALAAAAGAGLAPVSPVNYDFGTLLGLKGFAAAMLGGLGSMSGAVLGGFALGLAEALFAGYVSSAYADVVAFAVLLLVLFVRPTGLLAQVRVERV
jgi:branched-chain amino acid transport system permease protein